MKIPKADLKVLKRIASMMPKTKQDYMVTHVFTGKEIIDGKIPTQLQVDPKKIYYKRKPHYREVNHLTKLKKLYIREGLEGVNRYVNEMIELKKELEAIKAIEIKIPQL